MPTLAVIIGGGLSVYAAVVLLHDTDGPFDVFLRLRVLVGADLEVLGAGYAADDSPTTFLAKLFSCKWCLAVWVLVCMWALYAVWGNELVWIAASPLGLCYVLLERER